MKVFRSTQQAKVGCVGEVVALLKEQAATQPDRTIRIYTYQFGPTQTVVWEEERESVAERDRFISEWIVSPAGRSFVERLNPLIQAQTMEVLTLM